MRKWNRSRGRTHYDGGASPITEQFYARFQAPDSSNWPVISLYSELSGKKSDLLNKYLSDNIHKIEYSLNNIMYFENLGKSSFHKTVFKDLVWAGEDYPEDFKEEKKKSESQKKEELDKLQEIHNDSKYERELKTWWKWYSNNVTINNRGIKTAKDLLNALKTTSDISTIERTNLEIAKLARITWLQNTKRNRSAVKVGDPIQIIPINPIPKKKPETSLVEKNEEEDEDES